MSKPDYLYTYIFEKRRYFAPLEGQSKHDAFQSFGFYMRTEVSDESLGNLLERFATEQSTVVLHDCHDEIVEVFVRLVSQHELGDYKPAGQGEMNTTLSFNHEQQICKIL